MSLLGRYSNRYQQLNGQSVPVRPNIITENSPLQDLANASFGKAKVRCWTTPRDRKWGKVDQQHAAIMRFRMRATGPSDCRISDFEVDLNFSPVVGRAFDPNPAYTNPNAIIVSEDQKDVYLIELPAPSCIPGEPSTLGWRFRSDLPDDDDPNDRISSARWILEAKKDRVQVDGRILHGGIALRHPGQPFQVTCHVKGKVYKPGGFRFKFSNYHHDPRLWQVVPVLCDDDLQHHINHLEAEMVRLNTFTPNQAVQLNPASQNLGGGGSHSFGSADIGGSAHVVMGDVNYNYTGRPHIR